MQEMLPQEGGFADFTALLDDDDAPPAVAATPAAGGGTPGLAPGELPWARASQRIHSPLLRLHNGGPYTPKIDPQKYP